MQQGISVDFSLGLINRTGAYHISKDLVEGLRPLISDVYYWRLRLNKTPSGILRKLLARMMLVELRTLRDARWFPTDRGPEKSLYLDPLYVLRSRLKPEDVVLCHDVGPLTHPSLFDAATVSLYNRAYDKIARVAPGMVFVSHASREAFVRLFGSEFRLQRVITLYPRREIQSATPRGVPDVDRPFLLSVGALEHRKNYLRCMEAFRQSVASRSHMLIICGPRGNSSTEVREAAKQCSNIRVLGSVGDEELSWLYQHADGFLLPSLLEGFGVPVIEAAERGLVCVTSAGGAQEEALGGHGIFVDPEQTSAIVAGIDRLLAMSETDKADYVAQARKHTATLTRERFLNAWLELVQQELGASESAWLPGCTVEA